jgi:hypothetical protein
MAEEISRDSLASLKLLGALVRLDAASPNGFTAQHLSRVAQVGHETARAFLNPGKGPAFTEVCPSLPVRPAVRGRPANLYRVKPERRSELFRLLAEIRLQLGPPEGAGAEAVEMENEAWDLLDGAIGELEQGSIPAELWRGQLEEARLELRGLDAELQAMTVRAPAKAADFRFRFEGLRDRLTAVEKGRRPAARPSLKDHFAEIVERFGRWRSPAPALFDPLLVLLEGIEGSDAVASAIARAANEAEIRVAAFDLCGLDEGERKMLFAALDRLRLATPLAVSDFVLALDGRTRPAKEFAYSFKQLARLDAPQGPKEAVIEGVGKFDLDELRREYFSTGDLVGNAKAAYVTSAISLCAAVDKTADMSIEARPLPVWGLDTAVVAKSVMGNMLCVDASHNDEIERTLEGEAVAYVKEASGFLDPEELIPMGPYAQLFAGRRPAASDRIRNASFPNVLKSHG